MVLECADRNPNIGKRALREKIQGWQVFSQKFSRNTPHADKYTAQPAGPLKSMSILGNRVRPSEGFSVTVHRRQYILGNHRIRLGLHGLAGPAFT